jgi:hypothetical protein
MEQEFIPTHFKTAADQWPTDGVFYFETASGRFLCRNSPWFRSSIRVRDMLSSRNAALMPHRESLKVSYPRLARETLEQAVGFFDHVAASLRSEAVLLLVYDLNETRLITLAPRQTGIVGRFENGARTPMRLEYDRPPLPPGRIYLGDLHSHANLPAFTSCVDDNDETCDGIFGIVGRVHSEPPEFHLSTLVDGQRFMLSLEMFCEGYERRRQFPEQWLDQVRVSVEPILRQTVPLAEKL